MQNIGNVKFTLILFRAYLRLRGRNYFFNKKDLQNLAWEAYRNDKAK